MGLMDRGEMKGNEGMERGCLIACRRAMLSLWGSDRGGGRWWVGPWRRFCVLGLCGGRFDD